MEELLAQVSSASSQQKWVSEIQLENQTVSIDIFILCSNARAPAAHWLSDKNI